MNAKDAIEKSFNSSSFVNLKNYDQADFDYLLNECESYSVKNEVWTFYGPEEKDMHLWVVSMNTNR